MKYKEMVAPYVGDVSLFLWNALKEGKEILLEGQLGSLKDPDHGIYPMVTSSSTLAAYGAIGAGVPPYEIKKVITVCKAYSSAVGAGAFVSEIFGEEADELRRRGGDGGEYGATTGRPRRMGWFDCVASKYGCRMQGTTDVASSPSTSRFRISRRQRTCFLYWYRVRTKNLWSRGWIILQSLWSGLLPDIGFL